MTTDGLGPRQALRLAPTVHIHPNLVAGCLDLREEGDALFERTRRAGLGTLTGSDRYAVNRVTGHVAEALAEILLAEVGFTVFWHITTDGIHGVDLLFLSPHDRVLALEVKGTLRRGSIPRLTSSRLRQMSRDWLNDAGNPGMSEWQLQADDLYAGVMSVDLAATEVRLAVSHDFVSYVPVADMSALDLVLRQ